MNRYHPEIDGIVRFICIPEREKPVRSDHASVIYEDPSGTLWLCARGIHRFDRTLNRFELVVPDSIFPTSQHGEAVTFLTEDNAGRFWVSSAVVLRTSRKRGIFDVFLAHLIAGSVLQAGARL